MGNDELTNTLLKRLANFWEIRTAWRKSMALMKFTDCR